MLTIDELLNNAARELAESATDTPRLDAEILLARILDKPRTYLMTWPEREVAAEQVQRFERWIGRRLQRRGVLTERARVELSPRTTAEAEGGVPTRTIPR